MKNLKNFFRTWLASLNPVNGGGESDDDTSSVAEHVYPDEMRFNSYTQKVLLNRKTSGTLYQKGAEYPTVESVRKELCREFHSLLDIINTKGKFSNLEARVRLAKLLYIFVSLEVREEEEAREKERILAFRERKAMERELVKERVVESESVVVNEGDNYDRDDDEPSLS